jgi:hypothetical protein
VAASLILQPFTSIILVDNGAAQLTLQGIQPSFSAASEAQDFTLILLGTGFSTNSVVRWNGVARPTVFVNSTRLSAAISAADVSALGDIPVTVWDPIPGPGGTETQPVLFHVVEVVYQGYLPMIGR